MFGEGSYSAEDSAKADQYCCAADTAFAPPGEGELGPLHQKLYQSGAQTHPGDVCYLVLSRVMLGHYIRTQHKGGQGAHQRGIAMDDGASSDGCVFATTRRAELVNIPDAAPTLPYHSLLVELGTDPSHAVARFREFVVFHAEQLCPEYVVAYSRAREPAAPP